MTPPPSTRSTLLRCLVGDPLGAGWSEATWKTIAAAATYEEAEPLLHARVSEGTANLPPAVRDRLAVAYAVNGLHSALRQRELTTIVEALGASGIEVIVLKGVHLAYAVYADPALRVMSDIDLLVRPGALSRARDVMLALGYTQEVDEPVQTTLARAHHLPSFRKAGASPVEIHWTLSRPPSPFALDLDAMWARRRTLAVGDLRVQVFGETDLLHHLCLHLAYNHGWIGRGQREIPLRAVVDIALSLRRHAPSLDWPCLVSEANAARSARFVYCALAVVGRLTGCAPPGAVLRALDHSIEDDAVVDTVCALLLEAPATDIPEALKHVAASTHHDRPRVIGEALFPPRDRMRVRYGLGDAQNVRPWHYARRFAEFILGGRWASVLAPKGLAGMRQALRRLHIRAWKHGAAIVIALLATGAAQAQHPFRHFAEAVEVRYAATQPVVSYTLRVDPSDTSGFAMEMRIRGAPDSFRVAMAAYPEYDDRFWRYMGDVRVEAPPGAATVVRTDSSIWRVAAPGGEATLRWRVGVPFEPRPRGSWRPFIASSGALVGGPHSFLYVLGAELAPAHVLVEVPRDWTIATGLVPTSDPRRYFAPSVDALVDSPILTGRLRDWSFTAGDVPHRVVYWPSSNAAPFDTAAFVRHVAGIAREGVALFGRAPYREFVYMFQDDAYGGLEHVNSVTIGARSDLLGGSGMADVLLDMTHEYFHTWNLVRIRPAERGGVSPRKGGRSYGLWFSEGLTMFYADLLARRAGAPTDDSTRITHVERILENYYNNPSNSAISPERASYAEYGGDPGDLGDYDPSPHNQGEVIGTVLDLLVRERTRDARSMDDVMREMMRRFSGDSGFTGRGVERAVADVCGCSLRAFFDRYVRAAAAIPVNDYLRAIGLRAETTRVPQTDAQGNPSPDLRIVAWNPTPGDTLRLRIYNPSSGWACAGIHTGDRLLAFDGAPVADWRGLRTLLTRLRIGDTARLTIRRGARTLTVSVPVTGFERTQVRLVEIPGATAAQRERRARWLAGR